MDILKRLRDLKEEFPLYSRVVEGGVWKIGGMATVSILSVVINAILTRVLIPGDMGDFLYILSVVATVSMIAKIGLGETAIREIAGAISRQKYPEVSRLLQEIFIWGIVSICLSSLFFFIFGEAMGIRQGLVLLSTAWIVVLTGQKIGVDIIRGFHETRIATLLHGGRIGGPVASAVSVVLLLIVRRRFQAIELTSAIQLIMLGGFISFLVTLICMIININEKLDRFEFGFQLPSLVILGSTLPILFHSIGSSLHSQSSVWILKMFQLEREIAIFGTSQQLANLLMILQNITVFVLSPEIASLFADGKLDLLEDLQRRTAAVALIPALIGFLIFIVGGRFILDMFYGEFYQAGKPVLLILSVGYLFHVFAGACGLTLVMTGHQLKLMKITLVSAFVSFVAGVVLVTYLGLLGVALAASGGYIIKNIWMVFSVKKHVGIKTYAGFKWFHK